MRQFVNRPLPDGFSITGIIGNYFKGRLCGKGYGKKKKKRQGYFFHRGKLEKKNTNYFKDYISLYLYP